MTFIPYGKPNVDQTDIDAVIEVLHTDWLTTGPYVEVFENAFAEFVGAEYAIAVNSGTAALHAALHCLDLSPGDEVIVPTLTFAASANAVCYVKGVPVFADVDQDTLLIDPVDVERKITARTRAIVAVDYAGQPCDYDALHALCKKHNLVLIADACHAPGASYKGKPVGTLADMSTFSFHPVKHLTTAEGGMITTRCSEWAKRMRRFRNHGIDTDHRQRAQQGMFTYDMTELGYNYRLPDVLCALGTQQLKKMPFWLKQRRKQADYYNEGLIGLQEIQPLVALSDRQHAYHLYVVKIAERDRCYHELRQAGIGANVHYTPVHLHSYYQNQTIYQDVSCPIAEKVSTEILTLPLYPGLERDQQDFIIERLQVFLSDLKSG